MCVCLCVASSHQRQVSSFARRSTLTTTQTHQRTEAPNSLIRTLYATPSENNRILAIASFGQLCSTYSCVRLVRFRCAIVCAFRVPVRGRKSSRAHTEHFATASYSNTQPKKTAPNFISCSCKFLAIPPYTHSRLPSATSGDRATSDGTMLKTHLMKTKQPDIFNRAASQTSQTDDAHIRFIRVMLSPASYYMHSMHIVAPPVAVAVGYRVINVATTVAGASAFAAIVGKNVPAQRSTRSESGERGTLNMPVIRMRNIFRFAVNESLMKQQIPHERTRGGRT